MKENKKWNDTDEQDLAEYFSRMQNRNWNALRGLMITTRSEILRQHIDTQLGPKQKCCCNAEIISLSY